MALIEKGRIDSTIRPFFEYYASQRPQLPEKTGIHSKYVHKKQS